MKIEDFERLVQEAWSSLPLLFKKKLNNIAIIVEEEPGEEERKMFGGRGKILGYYRGVPYKYRGVGYANVPPDAVVIFKNCIEEVCENEKEIKDKVREVLLHEIGHYFGFSEEDLRRLGCG